VLTSAEEGNRLSRFRMAKEIQCILGYITLHDTNVTQFAVKHRSYTNATTGYLIDDLDLLAYYYVSAFTNTKSDPTRVKLQFAAYIFHLVSKIYRTNTGMIWIGKATFVQSTILQVHVLFSFVHSFRLRSISHVV